MSVITVTPATAYEELVHCAKVGLVPYLKSSPGMGKSSIVKRIAKDFGLKLIDMRLSQCMPEDLQGFPMRTGDKASFVPFDTFPIEGDTPPKGYEGWLLFMDELSSASKQVQAAAYKVILDRMVGSHHLHPQVVVMAAGNLTTDKAVVVQMSTALQSRVIHYEMESSHTDWLKLAAEQGFDKRIQAYIAYKPSKLMNFSPDHTEHTFACPRTWEFLSRLIKGVELESTHLPRVAGTIGEGVAVEFMAFAREFDRLPKIDAIVTNPLGATVPAELSTRYATMVMLTEHTTLKNVKEILDYVDRFDIELRIIFLRMLLAEQPMLASQSVPMSKYVGKMAKYLS